jgi:hypothetical protein
MSVIPGFLLMIEDHTSRYCCFNMSKTPAASTIALTVTHVRIRKTKPHYSASANRWSAEEGTITQIK